MMKFLFCGTEEPQDPIWQTRGTLWRSPTGVGAPSRYQPQLWQYRFPRPRWPVPEFDDLMAG